MPLFTQVRGRLILGTSPYRVSKKFGQPRSYADNTPRRELPLCGDLAHRTGDMRVFLDL
jgi:hypothetical protein